MLTIQDCIELSELTAEEIDAIAEHEHVSTMVAAEMGWYLVQTPEGEKRVKRMIVDDIDAARERGDHARAGKLKLVLKHFLEKHTEAG